MTINAEAELDRLLARAAQRDASDVHLVASEPPVFRVRGRMEREEADPLSAEDIEAIVRAAFGPHGPDKALDETGCAITMVESPGVAEGRLCVTRAGGAMTAVIRILPAELPDPARARVPQALLDAALLPNGLVIVAGEAGSGKTTVAMILLEHVNTNKPANIQTIEDPVSVRLTPRKAIIRQQNVGTDTPSYTAALKAIMRQDPDVVFVGEVRDLLTLEAVITLANTGHLVITQVHASSPADVIQRIVDVHPEEARPIVRRRLGDVLRAVSVQKLLPSAKRPGRIAAYGLLVLDKEMRLAVAEGRDITRRVNPLPEGCQELPDDIERLRKEGLITDEAAEEALATLR